MRRRDGIRVTQRLRSHPILAIGAMEIAAEHAKAHGERSWKRMEERLLLDRIELKCAYVSMRNQQFTAAIKANSANTVESVENDTAVSAGKTSQPAVFQHRV